MKAYLCALMLVACRLAVGAVPWANLDAGHHLGGRKTSEGYLQGKVVLVVRCDVTDPACTELLQRLEEIWTNYKTKQFVILCGTTGDGGAGDEKASVAGCKLSYPVYAGAALAEGEPKFGTLPFLYTVDETGKVVYLGHDERVATQSIVQALTDMDVPRNLKQWQRFLDFELVNLPAHAYNRLNAFRKKFPEESNAYLAQARALVKDRDVKRVADLVEFAKRAKDAPAFGPKEKAKRKKYEELVNEVLERCAPLKDVANPRLAREARNALADLKWTKATF